MASPDRQDHRLYDMFKRLKREVAHLIPPPPLRPSEMMLLHSVLRLEHGAFPPPDGPPPPEPPLDKPDGGEPPRPVTISDLSHFLGQTPSAVSQTVKSLEQKHMVERVPGRADRRVITVRLTAHGREVFADVEAALTGRLDRITETMGREDTEQLLALLEKLLRAFEATRRPPPPPASFSSHTP